MFCSNKGCGKSQEPLLDKSTNEVYCAECNNVIPNVPSFTKNVLSSMGQVKRFVPKQKAFSRLCASCNKTDQPVIANGQIVCPICKAEVKDITPTYAHALRQFISKV